MFLNANNTHYITNIHAVKEQSRIIIMQIKIVSINYNIYSYFFCLNVSHLDLWYTKYEPSQS